MSGAQEEALSWLWSGLTWSFVCDAHKGLERLAQEHSLLAQAAGRGASSLLCASQTECVHSGMLRKEGGLD